MRPEARAGEALRTNNLTLALAESCTGGLIASLVTDVPGSSEYFLASLVTYDNRSKVRLLGVSEETLAAHGAVSEEVAMEMAAGARRATGADVALSVTGIAGPGGATPTKPVGLVYFALDVRGEVRAERVVFEGDRKAVKAAAAEHALRMIASRLG
ncbi:MAG: CinA family protein [Methanomassiliicoccus sp.]|nr:CinA family protein [Methanomassiliicoccus sp.]